MKIWDFFLNFNQQIKILLYKIIKPILAKKINI